MKKISIHFLLLTLLFLFSASTAKTADKKDALKSGPVQPPTVKKVDGVVHIYNSASPAAGVVALELKKILEIDSLKLSPENPVFFNRVSGAKNGGVNLGDMRNFKIYAFDAKGRLLTQFFGKGQGPGELPFGVFSIQPFKKDTWVLSSRKIIRFDANKKLVEEIKFKTKYRGIELVDENRFIGNFFVYDNNNSDKSKRRKCTCALFDRKETVQQVFLEDFKAGITEVVGKFGGQELRLNFSAAAVTPMIIHRLDSEREKLYLCVSNEYSIILKTLKGETVKVIHREHQNRALSEIEQEEIAETVFARQPPQIRKIIKENLPGNFCAVSGIQALPRGWLAVTRITGVKSSEIDVFDPDGRYMYQLKFPADIPASRVHFFGGTVSIIEIEDDRDIYRQYRIKNLPAIFAPASPLSAKK